MTGTQPPPPNRNAPPQWLPPQPQRRALSSGRIMLVLLLALVVVSGIVVVVLIWLGRQQEPAPRTITPIPRDVCNFIGVDALQKALPEAELTSEPATRSGSPATCEARTDSGTSLVVEITRFQDSANTTAEERARQAFTVACRPFQGKWHPVDPADTTPPAPAASPDLGHPVCGKPGVFTELTVVQGYTLVSARFTGGDSPSQWTALPDRATELAERVLQRLETLE